MRCELSIFKLLFHGNLQSYIRAHKQNTKQERKRQKVINVIECYKDFIFMTNSYFPELIQGSNPIEKKTLAKRSEFSLI